jgi:hypothetical protein
MRRPTPLLLLLLALTASASGSPADAQDPRAGIRSLLERRAEAVLAGDEQAFLDTVDPSDPRFVERQRLLFRGFERIGLSSYDLRLEASWPELTTDRERARYGAAASPKVFQVEERWAVRGFDRRPAVDSLFLTFVRRNGAWRVASDTDLDDLALFSGRKLWEFGSVISQDSDHFRFLSHPDLRSAGPAVLDAAERALGTVSGRWPDPVPARVLILAPSTTEELGRLIQATFDLDVFVAFAYSALDRQRDWDLVGHRILLNWENFVRYPDEAREQVLAHELLHIATREVTGPMVPVFLEEGIADWVAGDVQIPVVATRVQRGTFDGRLPRDFEFIAGADEDIAASYEESWSASHYLVDRFGAEALAELYSTLGDVRLAPGTPRYHVDEGMRDVLGLGYDEFERRWADWLEATL